MATPEIASRPPTINFGVMRSPRSCPQANLWSPRELPGTYQLEFYRRGTCRRGTCQLARSGQPAEDEASPQQPLIPREPTMRLQRLGISTLYLLLLHTHG